jgi:hypothetical protein
VSISTLPPRVDRPGLSKIDNDLRHAHRLALRAWMREHSVSRRTLADVLGCSPRRATDFYDGRAPLPHALLAKLSIVAPSRERTLRLALENATENVRRSA